MTAFTQVRMITGDNVLTAKSIAKEIGIWTNGAAIEGPDFRRMTPDEQKLQFIHDRWFISHARKWEARKCGG
jgi:magnesium-transporting ATPase (P-type)